VRHLISISQRLGPKQYSSSFRQAISSLVVVTSIPALARAFLKSDSDFMPLSRIPHTAAIEGS
jgi:hypothetical protein